MNHCLRENLLHDALGELSGPERRALQDHLRSCPSCAMEKEAFEGLLLQSKTAQAQIRPEFLEELEAKFCHPVSQKPVPWKKPLAWLSLAAASFLIWGFAVRERNLNGAGEADTSLQALKDLQEENGSWSGRVGTTAMATLAFLSRDHKGATLPFQSQVVQAMGFLTRAESSEPLEELLRCSVLLKERELTGAEPTAQLQLALHTAFHKAENSDNPLLAPLLREIVEKSKTLRLQTADGERILAKLALELGENVMAKADWQGVSRQLARLEKSSRASEPLWLASALLGKPSAF